MRVHLVDGTFELFRAHFSPKPPRVTPDGRDVKGTLGLIEQMLTLALEKDEAVTHLAIAFDNPIRSFRNDLFDGYKGDEGVPPTLRAQFDLVEEVARAAGFVVWSMDQWEADDALATAALRFAQDPNVEQVRILSVDKDLMQCVQGAHVVLVDRIRRRVFDEEGVQKHWGVGPKHIPELLALTGDTADGIPGVPGIGPKTAAALLTAFGSIDAIPREARAWPKSIRGADRLAPAIAEHAKVLPLYRTLATLTTDVPLKENLDALRLGPLGGPAFEAACKALGEMRLPERLARRTAASNP